MGSMEMALVPTPPHLAVACGVNDDEIIDKFHDLFDGNHEYYGAEDGGCITNPHYGLRPLIAGHLDGGSAPIGVYPIWGNEVKWGCIDFDEGEEISLIHARNVRLVLHEFGVVGHIERSRSKGFHVWVLAASWGAAGLMREALLATCDLVDAPSREVNPKQSELAEGQVGNYVRLPYPNGLKQDGYTGQESWRPRVMLGPSTAAFGWLSSADTDEPQSQRLFDWALRDWLPIAIELRADWANIKDLAALYKPARPDKHSAYTQPIVHAVPSEHYSGDARGRMRPLTKWIYDHGPADRSDRSSALWKFACLLAEDGRHTYDEALELLTDADTRWGKFMVRADGEERLEDLLEKAWRDRATLYESEA